jgi:hypothetical protein
MKDRVKYVEEINMNKYKTKYFGEISFEDNPKYGYKNARIEYNNHLINIFIDEDIYKNKMDTCLNIIDKYFEINVIVKNVILDNYSNDYVLNNSYKCCFENHVKNIFDKIFGTRSFRKINLKCVQKKMEYPNLHFNINNENNELEILLSYILSNYCPFGFTIGLQVLTNEEFNIFEFGHGDMMIC